MKTVHFCVHFLHYINHIHSMRSMIIVLVFGIVFALTLCADNTVVRGFGMGDRCSFFQVFLSISSINAMWKNEHHPS